ncbi:dihydroorotase [Glycocaulis alkaliphilus]|uniref:Dihydroorotase n=1 Tax=Glycocaulis alkaliphilus TaxID=1434191 RepID=A0A3T0EC53_9PROT|nr:dihydroorotase [Glycocaulis alkaliphilus]AZU04880.1 dihydroorotase [Glycocaulis alkaliphilus]GGB66953.1 dihydroorotase [Glycocaulis alkaliphilus]
MSETFDTLIKGGTIVSHAGRMKADIGIRDGRFAAIGDLSAASAGEVIDAKGLHVLPGVIDTQVHFREPGLEWKEDLESGSRAAALGGVVCVFEMPNTNPATTTPELMADKVKRGTHRMHTDFAFYAGATKENVHLLREMELMAGCCGVKVFMGASTGDLLVDTDEGVAAVLNVIERRAAFHSEDEFRLADRRALARHGDWTSHVEVRDDIAAMQSTQRLVRLAREAGKRIHVLHISTADEIDYLQHHKDVASVEVTPQHLTLAAPECYERLGAYAQMNPPVRNAKHREGLWRGVDQGIADILGSDHAPHTVEEKSKPYPASPSGMPGVQTLVPLMLDHVSKGRLTLERFVDLTSHGPQRVFGLANKGRIAAGYDADLTLVDLHAVRTIEESWLASRCGWSPFTGDTVTGWPMATIVRGKVVMRDDELVTPSTGEAARFVETLGAV